MGGWAKIQAALKSYSKLTKLSVREAALNNTIARPTRLNFQSWIFSVAQLARRMLAQVKPDFGLSRLSAEDLHARGQQPDESNRLEGRHLRLKPQGMGL